MNGKIKLIAVASLVAVMASGCSSYRGASQTGYDSGSSGSGGYSTSGETRGLFGQPARSGQVAGGGQQVAGGGQSQRNNTSATCQPCGATQPKAQSTYTYKPAKPATIVTQPRTQTSTHNQQYYIDKWNREQAQLRTQQPNKVPAAQGSTNYAGTGSNSDTTYYDYSSAGKTTTNTAGGTNVATSNKSIYTGSYQQKTYKPYAPTTYSGGSAAATNANTVVTSSGAGGSTYVVKKGDTVFEIMRQTGVYWKDIISINNLQPPYNINPGQTIRLK